MKSLRDYIELVEGQQLNEAPVANPTLTPDEMRAFASTGKLPAGKAGGPAQAAQPAKPVASTTPQPDPKGPGARPTGFRARLTGADARWDTANAAKWNPDGTAKKVAVAKAKPAAPAPQQAAQPAPQQAAQPAPQQATAPEAPAAPAAPTGPWPAGSPQDAAWQALTPEDQKWIGQADPTDQMILSRAPNGGKPAAAPAAPAQGAQPAPVAQAAMPGVSAGGGVVDTRGATAGQDEMEESVSFQNDEVTRLISLINYR